MRKLSTLLIILSVLFMVSCNSQNKASDNPLLSSWDTPFGMPPFEQIKPEHYKPALEEAIKAQVAEIATIVENKDEPTFENTILALDNSGKLYSSVGTILALLNSADTNEALQAVNKEMLPIMTKHGDDIYLSDALYKRVHSVYERASELGLDELQTRLTNKTHQRFTLAGAHLSEQGKEALRKINGELSMTELQYAENVLADNKSFQMMVEASDVVGLPADLVAAAAALGKEQGEDGKYIFTVDKPSLLPFLTSSNREDLRKTLYGGYLNRCNYDNDTDNKQVINDLIRLRIERANLLGYDSHADYILQERMAKSPQEIYSLLDALWTPALAGAKEELKAMQEIKQKQTGNKSFNSWDWWYYADQVRKQKYDLDEELLRPYFSLENVQNGIFYLCNRLWGLTFTPVSNAPVYNKECTVYEVFDADDTHLGVLVMDFFPRAGKRVGAWCGSYRTRTYNETGVKTDPIVTIVCNFTRPSGDKPALLTLEEVTTFFHEFGHAVHALCTDVPYRGLIRVERDFVELQSQMMENWAFEPQMLRHYATHFLTNEIIPNQLIDKIANSGKFNQGFVTTEYLAASLSDMDMHTKTKYEKIDVNAFERESLNTKRGLIDQIAPRYRYPYFSHIFSGGYSAGYYSYIWAEVLDKDAYQAFVESGDIFNPKLAATYREHILNKGGSEDGMDLYVKFRGAEPAREPLLYSRGLLEEPVVEKVVEPVDFGFDQE